MREDFSEKLLKFYLGDVGDVERTEVEDALLSSSEKLSEFIALKRAFELDDLPLEPSRAFRFRLRAEAERRFARDNRSFLKIWIPVGAFALVLLVVLGVFKMRNNTSAPISQGISFDSGGDSAVSLSVL
jgi:hypothetical protein